VQKGVEICSKPVKVRRDLEKIRKPWVKQLLTMIKNKERLYMKVKCKNPSPRALEEYRISIQTVTKYKRELQNANIVNTTKDVKVVWRNINEILRTKKQNVGYEG
jgi:DNA-binding transcriptional regulator YhcF (GntR family)